MVEFDFWLFKTGWFGPKTKLIFFIVSEIICEIKLYFFRFTNFYVQCQFNNLDDNLKKLPVLEL